MVGASMKPSNVIRSIKLNVGSSFYDESRSLKVLIIVEHFPSQLIYITIYLSLSAWKRSKKF